MDSPDILDEAIDAGLRQILIHQITSDMLWPLMAPEDRARTLSGVLARFVVTAPERAERRRADARAGARRLAAFIEVQERTEYERLKAVFDPPTPR